MMQPVLPAPVSAVVPPAQAVTRRLPSLDGWRAVSILLVLGGHSVFATGFPDWLKPAFNTVFDSGLGVRCFFIISGFLITWLMVLERDEQGSVNLREFYIRRALRILPVYLTYLAVLALLEVTGVDKETPAAWLGNLTFTRNSFGYANEGDALSAHLWSLSVEEQFYVAWPLLFFLFGKKSERLIPGILAMAILASCAIRGVNYLNLSPLQNFYAVLHWNSLRFFDCLAFGCAGAVLFAHRREMIERTLKPRPRLTAVIGLMLILFPHYALWLPLKPVAIVEFYPGLQALGFSILLLHSIVSPEWGFYQTLNRKWICRIGIWSYSIYIWQQLFWPAPRIFGLDRIWWLGLWLIPLSVVTIISYYGLERPFFRLRSRHREVKIEG